MNTFPPVPADNESRPKYPSDAFFRKLLAREVAWYMANTESWDELMEHLRSVWTVRERRSLIDRIESHIWPSRPPRNIRGWSTYDTPIAEYLDEMEEVLTYLIAHAEKLSKGDRWAVDQTIRRLSGNLPPERQVRLLTPWFSSERPSRIAAVIRAMREVRDLSPYADDMVAIWRSHHQPGLLKLIARTPGAAAKLRFAELRPLFETYAWMKEKEMPEFATEDQRYLVMSAARILLQGPEEVPPYLLEGIPHVLVWAIGELRMKEHAGLLRYLVRTYADSPRVLWTAMLAARACGLDDIAVECTELGIAHLEPYGMLPKPMLPEWIQTLMVELG